MPDDNTGKRVLDLCDEALELAEADRVAFLNKACDGDERLRASVHSVLLAVSSAGDFLDAKALSGAPQASLSGKRIGHYTLETKLGSGGMGAVYRAVRDDGEFEQRVAVKLVHGHLLTDELVERFNTERRILATLNHPYIASMIDGGTTQDGIPYLVMEYIDGVPIDQFCNDNTLNTMARVKLIRKVALAVEAAHRNLVVHRDLKPSNVLITADGIPKLLDFGIAKLALPESLDKTGHTVVFGHQAITPDYASPEQILENEVTTVSDVYSLGVLAYELLVGERPYHVDAGSHRALVEAIDGLTVQRPSACLETITDPEVIERIVRHRGTTASRLKRALRGDLDNILLKALQRDPARRYQSVSLFSNDLVNYMARLPVTARADSLGYRVGKFLKRNWLASGAALIVLLSLVSGLVITQQQKEIARREADHARKVTSFLQDVLSAPSAVAGTAISSGQDATVADLVGLAAERVEAAFPDQPEIQAQLYSTLASANRGLGRWDEALALSDRALQLLSTVSPRSEVQATARFTSALIRFHGPYSDTAGMLEKLTEAEWYAAETLESPSKLHAHSLFLLGQLQSNAKAREAMLHEANEEWLAAGGDPNDDLIGAYRTILGTMYFSQGKLDEAEAELLTGIDILDGDGDRKLIDLGFAYESLGAISSRRGNYAQAREHLLKAIEALEQSAPRNPWQVIVHIRMAEVARLQGNLKEAQLALDRVQQLGSELAMTRQAPHWTLYANELAELNLARGNYKLVIDNLTSRLNENPPTDLMIQYRVKSRYLIALAHSALGEQETANAIGSEAYRDFVKFHGDTESARALRERLEAAGIQL